MPDFTADVDINKSEAMSEEETKPVQEPQQQETPIQGNFQHMKPAYISSSFILMTNKKQERTYRT